SWGTHAADDLPDREQALALLHEDKDLSPTVVVDTGGGFHAWWFLDRFIHIDEAAPMLARWHGAWDRRMTAAGWSLDNVSDPARLMRLPGTRNFKTKPARPVAIVDPPWYELRFDLERIECICRRGEEFPPRNQSAPAHPSTPRRARPAGAGELVGDWMMATTS